MSPIVELARTEHPPVTEAEASMEWEAPSGPYDAHLEPRTTLPGFIYRGYAEAHWRGQTCHVVGAAAPDERTIVMACGCRARVASWTLEPTGPTVFE
jgi:hypothetical protein